MAFLEGIFTFLASHPSIIVGFIFLYVVGFLASVLFSKPKPGKNPFQFDTGARDIKELVTDQSARDKVLKQGFSLKRVPDDLDVIVIGSGIGGLSVASLLSKAGKKVLVLEQHDQAGGCCHTFIDKGFEFDVGIHYIGEMVGNQLSHCYLKQISDGQIEWVKLEDELDKVAIGVGSDAKFYPIMATGREGFKKCLLEKFPNEQKAIEKFMHILKVCKGNYLGQMMVKVFPLWLSKIMHATGLLNIFTKFFYWSQQSTKTVLDGLTDNSELKAVLAYNFGNYGSLPDEGSFTMHAALLNHFIYGGYYPKGGASEIAFHIIPVIERGGGRVLVRAPVTQILFNDKGKANGVRVHKSSGDIAVYAPLIISDAGTANTLNCLVPKEIACKSPMYDLLTGSKIRSGQAAFSLFVGLSGTKEELKLKAQNLWAYTGSDISGISRKYLSLSVEEAEKTDIPLLFVSFPSSKDPTWEERFPGKSVCVVVTLARWEWFEAWEKKQVMHRGDDYEAFKNTFAERMWEQTCSYYPQLRDKVEYFNIGTPVSNKYYIAAPRGEIYGLDHDVKRFSPEVVMTMRPKTGIPGLRLTGQDLASCGFVGALFGGLICASDVLHRNLFTDLVTLKKQIDKRAKKQN